LISFSEEDIQNGIPNKIKAALLIEGKATSIIFVGPSLFYAYGLVPLG
jgi:hypothetical protein